MKTSESRYHQCLYFTSNAFARKVEKLALHYWKPLGFSPSHGYLLMVVLQEPGVQPTKLANELQLTPSTITRLIEKLEGQALITRMLDGKTTMVYATDKAKALLPEMQAAMDGFYMAYSKILGPEASCALTQQIATVADALP
ncbi:MAG: MarR family winged helix-turn-helix transcriptional regulator [Chitinophagaceae bacterium]